MKRAQALDIRRNPGEPHPPWVRLQPDALGRLKAAHKR
jgi:hypothetical protein